MKKIKIMLMSLALLAVVGGALAWKAKVGGTLTYCTAPTNASGPVCPQFCEALITTGAIHNQAAFVCTTDATTTVNPGGGPDIYTCTTTDLVPEPDVIVKRQCGSVTARVTNNQ